ncbi:mandelate racemase/muconate lactonizing enzyme family protein [Acuticoccus kandeliae]|uniref:mandelate racemase/muconate lactonizing enzyme family protein n=1 Tax=Acuticoccus kandeliae TaxID=2073160 RepID=UPI000D3E1879|nr:mandelate racemase/muconate lactonizing enzyme family protein [Acuticoccus kandeliae]
MPRIAEINAIPLVVSVGADRAFGNARGRFDKRGSIVIEVVCDDGTRGWGEAWGAAPAATLGYFETIKPLYIGRDVFDRNGAWHRILQQMYSVRVQNQLTAVVSGINIALYDIAGKVLGLPVYKLLGAADCDSVPCYASGGYFANDPKNQLEHQLARVAGEGFTAHKIKIGAGVRDDAARTRLAREIIGSDPLLLVDVNGAYNEETAYASMRRIEEYDIHWMEEPVMSEDFAGLERLGRRRTIPIASGESHMTCHEFKRLLETDAVDILMPDLTLCGGLDEAQGATLLTRLHGARVSPHVWGTAIGLAAAIHYVAAIPSDPFALQSPYPSLVEYDYSENPLRDDLAVDPILPAAGLLPVPTGPGLGIELDESVLRKYAVA